MFSTLIWRVQTIRGRIRPVAALVRGPARQNTVGVPASLPTRALRVRFYGNWINGSSALGLVLARLGGATVRHGPDGLYLAERYRWRFPDAGAFTLGNVVITRRTLPELEGLQPHVLGHEDAHAWQYFWLAGLPFLPAYVAASAWSWLRTGDPASANAFERHAGLEVGGYAERPRTNEGLLKVLRLARPRRITRRGGRNRSG